MLHFYRISVILILFLLHSHIVLSQKKEITQFLRGRVVDLQSKYPLEAVMVSVKTADGQFFSGTSNENGEFRLSDIPLGRHTVKFQYLGYVEQTIPNVVFTAGKETEMNPEMEEMILETDEVVIKGEKSKIEPNNEMSTVSTRSFNMDETSRYAGSRNDPARMAMNFAGVSGSNDGRNDIIIRGNSPLGVLWRLEGTDIPSPNHFGAFGTTGGAISILNNNSLGKSDFMTGAFASQYGNALAGVFDLQMRKGNSSKREYMAQFGFLGLEAGLEGPFSKKSSASYIVYYRYSTLGILKALNFNFGTSALPQYQDLSFKVDVPTKKAGKFTLFGIGGLSDAVTYGDKTDTTDLYIDRGYNVTFKSNMGALGLSHMFFHSEKTYSKTTLALSGNSAIIVNDSIPQDSLGNFVPQDANGTFTGTPITNYRSEFGQWKLSLNYQFNTKVNVRNTIVAGIIGDYMNFNLADSVLNSVGSFVKLRDTKGSSFLLQAYAQWQHRFNEKLTLNAGAHYQHFFYNNTWMLEPRAGIKYMPGKAHTISLGFGIHSQLQPLQVYFREDKTASGETVKSNTDLDFTKSAQVVLGYDVNVWSDFRIKAEAYYQHLYDVPIDPFVSTFSIINAGASFIIESRDSLVNQGEGYNYGFEITLEKFFSKGYYFLFTGSVYDSRYRASDGIWRNTAFNSLYTLNLLAGKEFKITKKTVLIADLKTTLGGGRRYTPVDFDKSLLAGETIYDESNPFIEQFPVYFRIDLKIGMRANWGRTTHELSIDLQNLLNRKNAFIQKYNLQTRKVIIVPQLGFIPLLQYKLTF